MNRNQESKNSILVVTITLGILMTVTGLFLILGGRDYIAQEIKNLPQDIENKNNPPKSLDATAPILQKKVVQTFFAPDLTSIPKDQLGESILRGREYLEHTFDKLPQFVGAKMNCTSCHLNSGTTQFAGPWVGVAARFPQYRSRSGKVDTLTDRVNDCFARSLNGKRLPEKSPEITDIISYMTWLSRGYAIGQDVEGSGMPKLMLDRMPDLPQGRKIYEAKCASCHQSSGQGVYTSSGKVTYPALWGKKSFNIGAGMARLQTAAGFVKKNMPLGQGGSMSDEDAWDVAAYFTQQERPDFKNKVSDWLKGDKPKDARY